MNRTGTNMTVERTSRVMIRLFGAGAICAGGMIIVTAAGAQELAQGEKTLPNVKDVLDMPGQSLATVFTKYGAPTNMTPWDETTKAPKVLIDYGPYSFIILNKKVTQCVFWEDWKGPVMGATIGGNADEIKKELGPPNEDIKNADGTELMTWNVTNSKSEISITFDKQHKSTALFFGTTG